MVRDGGALGALGDWADHVNLYGNAGAHPEVYGPVSPEEAKRCRRARKEHEDY